MNYLCPIDQKDDQIQKVSVIVAGGTSSGFFSGPTGGVVSHDGKTGTYGGWSSLSGGSSTTLAQMLMPLDEPQKAGCLEVYFYYCWLFVVIILFPLLIIPWFRKDVQKHKKAYENRNTHYPQDHQRWERSMVIWNRLYFCHRHGIVFDPANNAYFEPSQLNNYLLQS
jgi:hypothetical protein